MLTAKLSSVMPAAMSAWRDSGMWRRYGWSVAPNRMWRRLMTPVVTSIDAASAPAFIIAIAMNWPDPAKTSMEHATVWTTFIPAVRASTPNAAPIGM